MNKGQKINHLRINAGLTQEELARKIGTTKQNIYKYEMNIVSNIPSDKIEAMAKIFNVSPSYIMGWDDSPTVNDTILSDLNRKDNSIENDVIIYSRDGKTIKKKFTKEQMDYLHKFIDSISDDDCDL